MAKSIVRGKALVAKLRADPKVLNPEALAAWAGRHKHRKGMKGSLKSGVGKVTELKTGKSTASKKSAFDDDDPFNEDYGDDAPKSKKDRAREKYEAKLLRDMEKAERSRVHSIIKDLGGLKSRDDLREEYAGIPNTFKRKDGLAGDDLADHLSNYYPEFGIEDERDLIDFLAA